MIFFNSSMPRACSTLLQNILAQNPDIHATSTDGSLELLYGAKGNTESLEFKAMDPELRKKVWRAFCKGGLEAYCSAMTNKPNICVKSRGIGVHYNWYSAFMGQPPKVICVVRDLRAIISSMEKIFRKQAEGHQGIQNHAQMSGTATGKRVDIWLNSQPVGLAVERFMQMRLEGIDKQCLILRAEDLTSSPGREMEKVYEYLGLPAYAHDFDNVEQVTLEDDEVYGLTPDLHKTRPQVRPLKPDYYDVLGKPICRYINERCSEYQSAFNYL